MSVLKLKYWIHSHVDLLMVLEVIAVIIIITPVHPDGNVNMFNHNPTVVDMFLCHRY